MSIFFQGIPFVHGLNYSLTFSAVTSIFLSAGEPARKDRMRGSDMAGRKGESAERDFEASAKLP